jgi:ribose transport system ATP-binding protein
VLVLDEPTASLPPGAAQRLFDAIARVTAAGSGVLFVSHRLDEVLAVSQRISVLRDGRLVTTLDRADADEQQLVRLMLGRDLDEIYPKRTVDDERRPVVLDVEGMSGRLVEDVSLHVRAGEIVGVTGLVGMGQDELPYLVYGALPSAAGGVRLSGVSVPHLTPTQLRRRGVALVPADRPRASGALSASVTENISLPVLHRFFRRGALRGRHERANAQRLVSEYDVRPQRIDAELGQLSGGNQQKVLLAKWLQTPISVLLLHEPTLGVDIGSRAQIFGIVRAAADQGTGVLVASSEYEDLAGICDRVIVLHHGRVVAELGDGSLSEDAILRACFITAGDADAA